jgi:hypothetical protein
MERVASPVEAERSANSPARLPRCRREIRLYRGAVSCEPRCRQASQRQAEALLLRAGHPRDPGFHRDQGHLYSEPQARRIHDCRMGRLDPGTEGQGPADLVDKSHWEQEKYHPGMHAKIDGNATRCGAHCPALSIIKEIHPVRSSEYDTCPMAPTSSWAYLTRHLDESPCSNNGLFRNWAQCLYRFRFSPWSEMLAA